MNQKIQPFVGNDRLLLAMVLAVITFWLFAQTMINLAPTIQHDTAVFLMAGRIIQGLSAACIMPATLALIKTYYDGAQRQRAVSFWVIGAWGVPGYVPFLAVL